MKPQARIQCTIDLLQKIDAASIPMDLIIGDYMRHRRYIGAKDRAAIVQNVYDIIRSHAKIVWWVDKLNLVKTMRYVVLIWLLLAKNRSKKDLKDLFDGSKYSPEILQEEEVQIIDRILKIRGQRSSLEHQDMPEKTLLECPDTLFETLNSYFGDEFTNEMVALRKEASLDLRVNIGLSTREKTAQYLEAAGVKTEITPYSQTGLRCQGKAYLAKTKAFAKGWVEIQDEGSQLIAQICDVKPSMQVLDYCAGAGGKTLAIASYMQGKGRIVAMDTDERRLEKGRSRYKKAGVADIIEVRPLSETRHRKWLRRQKESFDVVLCDVPCTGTGTWRRNPDMRWNTYGPSLEELTLIQYEILEKVASCVKPGGKLVYATCSLLPQENEEQAENFIQNNPSFSLKPLEDSLGLGSPYMRLTPYRHSTDGFFAAIFEKKS